MVYVKSKVSALNKYIGKNLSVLEIKNVLYDLGMDVKGETNEKDPELKIEITAEKIDMISKAGIGRCIKYYLGLENKIPNYFIEQSNKNIFIEDSVLDIRPFCIGAIIREMPLNNEILEEIIELQEKIHESFGRGRKKAAIGVYPLDKIKFPIYYKAQKPTDIKFVPLDMEEILNGDEILQKHPTGIKFKHLLKEYKKYPILIDSNKKILSMPPIINSNDVGKVETSSKDLFIECTGYNLNLLESILKTIVTSFLDMGAKKAESVSVITKNNKYELNLNNFEFEVSKNYISSLIGIEFDDNELETLLNKMMYGLKKNEKDFIKIEIPTFRADVWNDCDIADDIARAYGYNNIKLKTPQIFNVVQKDELEEKRISFSNTLISLGFIELYTYMLTSRKDQKENLSLNDEPEIKLTNSTQEGINMVRELILHEILKSLVINRKNKYPQKVFENGWIVKNDNKIDVKSKEHPHLCIAIANPSSNYTNIKEIFDAINKIHNIKLSIKKKEFPFLINGRSGAIIYKNKEIGFIGELHPKILDNFGLLVPVSVMELNIENL